MCLQGKSRSFDAAIGDEMTGGPSEVTPGAIAFLPTEERHGESGSRSAADMSGDDRFVVAAADLDDPHSELFRESA